MAGAGRKVDNILRFERDFPGATVVRLERNYRSTEHILAAASGLIASNKDRLGKTLWTEALGGSKVQVRGVWDGEAESPRRGGRRSSAGPSVVRTRTSPSWSGPTFQMRAFEERFVLLQIPYTVVGGPRFFERAEIRDAHAYLRLVQSEDDDLAFERIVNTPRRGIGDTTVQTLLTLAPTRGRLGRRGGTRDRAQRRVDRTRAHGVWRRSCATSTAGAPRPQPLHHARLTETILEESGYTDAPAPGQRPDQPDAAGEPQGAGAVDGGVRDPVGLSRTRLPGDGPRSRRGRGLGHHHDRCTRPRGWSSPSSFLPGWEEGVFPRPAQAWTRAASAAWRRSGA